MSDAQTSPLVSFALNGRAFVGNTPTLVAATGQRIRWYVFNLDFSERWHNFHPHGQRFKVAGDPYDTRSLGPAESFVVDTEVPPVILLPVGCRDNDGGKKGRGRGKGRRMCLRGDFLVHCHVEMHMMQGMAATVRAIQEVTLDEDDLAELGYEPPVADPAYCRLLGHGHAGDEEHGHDSENDGHHGGHGKGRGLGRGGAVGHGHGLEHAGITIPDECPDVDPHPCVRGEGHWELLDDLDIFVVHAAVLHTGKVLLWSGTAEVGDPLVSRLWNPANDARTSQSYGEDLFCSGHAFLPDGRLCVAGGAPSGSMRSTHIFDPDPATEAWTKVTDMNQARWYPTALTLPDGRILAASGTGASELEIYDPNLGAGGGWTLVAGATRTFPELYPSLHLLPSGQIFYSRCGWQSADPMVTGTAHLTFTGPNSGAWAALGQQQFYDRQEGTAVIQIDTTVSPARTRVWVIGGGVFGAATARNPQTVEAIDLTTVGPGVAWDTPALTMTYPRTNVSAVLLPDGTVFVVGGQRAGKWNPDPQPVLEAEIFDPASGTFTPTAAMEFPRQYHSVAVLLPDGRVVCAGGIDPANPVERDQRQMEVFSPPYLDAGSRPTATGPTSAPYGATVTVGTNDPATVGSVVLIRPNSVTHHTDAGHRWIRLPVVGMTASSIDVTMPADARIAPPGWYMLFVVNLSGVPSEAHWIRMI